MLRLSALLTVLAVLGGCATYTDRTSPCACNWQPINADQEATV